MSQSYQRGRGMRPRKHKDNGLRDDPLTPGLGFAGTDYSAGRTRVRSPAVEASSRTSRGLLGSVSKISWKAKKLFKNPSGEASARQGKNRRKSAAYKAVNGDFEPIFNAGLCRVRGFQTAFKATGGELLSDGIKWMVTP